MMDRRTLNFFRSNLARQTFILFVLAAVLPVLFIAALSYEHVSDQLREQGYEQSRQSSKVIAMELLNYFTRAGEELAGISVPDRAQFDDPPGYPSPIPASQLPSFDTLALLARGRQTVSLRGNLEHFPELTTAQKNHLQQGRTLLMLQPGDRQESDILLLRQIDSAQAAAALVIGRLSRDSMEPLETQLAGAASLYLFGPDNTLLYASDGYRPVIAERLKQGLDTAISGNFDWAAGGVGEMASFWSLFTEPEFLLPAVTIVVSQPEEVVLAPIAQFQTLYFPGLLLLILLVSLVSANRIRQKLTPLVSLRDATRRVADGDFDERVTITSNDELAELGAAFNLMTKRLGNQFSSIATMAEIDRLILSSFDTRYIVSTVLSRAGDMTPCTVTAVLELDEGNGEIQMLSSRRRSATAAMQESQVHVSHEDIHLLKNSTEGLIVAGKNHCPQWLDELCDDDACQFLLLPALVRKKLAAVIIFGYDATCSLDDNNRDQLCKFTNHVAMALSNANWEGRLYQQAHYDALTRLPNRALLKDRLEQAIARATRNDTSVGLLFVDLDRFKLVNDSLGHAVGDSLLQKVAEMLRQSVRNVDTVVRFGGDEFVIIIPDIVRDGGAAAELEVIAGKILDRFHENILLDGHEIRVNSTIGIALFPKDGITPDELIKHADTAMYHAKESGRGCYRFFSPELNEAALRRFNIQQELDRALENDEFHVFYQPKYDCASGALYGAEALVRWHHPQKGILLPQEFITIADDTGQILKIGEWVLRNTCKQLKAWRDLGLPAFPVAVNISTRQLRDVDICSVVSQILEECGLDAGALELELTETSVMENATTALDTLKRLHSMGIRVAIDDFGTGYSSLSYLKDLPVDTLKVDQAFVAEMLVDPHVEAVVSTIIVLAHNLGLDVVAEGVETEEQRDRLESLQCDICQGYLYSQPIPAGRFEMLLRGSLNNIKKFRPGLR